MDPTDRMCLHARSKSTKGAVGGLRRCLFSRRDVAHEGKCKVYEGLVLAILLCSLGCWCLRESEVQELRSSHHDCVRTMCRISMWHVERHSTTDGAELAAAGQRLLSRPI
jgi:hypothetical protein